MLNENCSDEIDLTKTLKFGYRQMLNENCLYYFS